MRYVKGHGLQTRSRIVEEASYGLRQRGADGMSVADLMKLAGLTHGGFYAHFESREALVVEAFALAMDRTIAHWLDLVKELPPEERFDAFVQGYLSSAHRNDRAHGCVLPALGADIARSSPKARRTFGRKFGEMIDMVAQMLPEMSPEAGAPGRHQRACNHDGRDRARACGRRQEHVRRHFSRWPAGAAPPRRGKEMRPQGEVDMTGTWHKTACNLCYVNCGIEVLVNEGPCRKSAG